MAVPAAAPKSRSGEHAVVPPPGTICGVRVGELSFALAHSNRQNAMVQTIWRYCRQRRRRVESVGRRRARSRMVGA
jgi:hypothetical protein